MSQIALYHQFGVTPKPFAVLRKNKDGTVDIGPEDGEAVVTGVPVVTENPQPGQVLLVEADAAAATKTPKEPKTPKGK